jgi:hypothetical protein
MRKPLDGHRASDHVIDISRALASRFGASAGRSRLGRSQDFRAIAATSATTESKTADQ